MISFLEKEEKTIRERTNIGTSKEHAKYGIHNSTDSSRRTPQSITDHQPDTGATTTTPPPATRAAPNAPDLSTDIKSLNDEQGLKGGYAIGRNGKDIDQLDITQDMDAMPDDGEMQM
jgi:hypothetical protein